MTTLTLNDEPISQFDPLTIYTALKEKLSPKQLLELGTCIAIGGGSKYSQSSFNLSKKAQ
jgi:hypothetical protein